MIVSPDVCKAKISSTVELGLEKNDNVFISESELEVAGETEIVAEDGGFENNDFEDDVEDDVEDGGFEDDVGVGGDVVICDGHALDVCYSTDLEQPFDFRGQPVQLQQHSQQNSQHFHQSQQSEQRRSQGVSFNKDVGNDNDHRKIDEWDLLDLNDNTLDSVSTLSIDDCDPSLLEEQSFNLSQEDDIFNSGDFNNVFNFCNNILTQSIRTTEEATKKVCFKSFDIVEEGGSLDNLDLNTCGEDQSSCLKLGQTFGFTDDVRKSVRIAEKKRIDQSHRRSDDTDDDAEAFELREDENKSLNYNPRMRRNSKCRSHGNENRDSDFVLRRVRSVSKNRSKGRKIISFHDKVEDSSDIMQRAHKQEKNRLAARRCRLKQKNLTDTLDSEVRDLELIGNTLKDEIHQLQGELMNLKCVVKQHDSLVMDCPMIYHCPIGPTNL